ncbi:MAG: aconitase/3-isopropylmalate dehydratase large subunit family protein [Isosphaeraceae bacterium]|nr:aconitase/3-isopropylmalate dehydratase large subunit family protein [Isosphaeraceae bacterium]
MTLVESIIAQHACRDEVSPGDIVMARVDAVYLQDGNTPTIRKLVDEHGFDRVFDPGRIAVFFDHAVLTPDRAMSDRLAEAEEFAARFGLRVYRRGAGISHVVALEEGWFQPGGLVVGADSHTCTGGAVQCLALGMGASDVVAAMVTGTTWLRVPGTIWIETVGRPGPWARPKDVLLYALARFGQRPFLYHSIEWLGDWISELSLDGAATVANMGVEQGAKCVFLPPGAGRPENMVALRPQADGRGQVLRLDLTGLPPFVARPHSPLGAVGLDEVAGQEIDYVFIGSCANGRLEDLAEVARVLTDTTVHPRVQCIVTPASLPVYLEALKRGHLETILKAGAVVSPPGCGACIGTQGSVPATHARVFSTMNRNFRGRMGNPEAEIWLGSPLVAALTAVLGRIPQPGELI